MFTSPPPPEPSNGNSSFLRIGLGIIVGLTILLFALVLQVFPPGTEVRTQLLQGEGPWTFVPGGSDVPTCGDYDDFGAVGTGLVAGVRIAQQVPIEEGGGGGGRPRGLRKPNPLFSFRGKCIGNSVAQRLWMIRALDLTNDPPLDAEQVQRVAEDIVDASVIQRPQRVIRVPNASLSAVITAVQSWPPADLVVYGPHAAPDALKIRTDEDLESAKELLAEYARAWGGAAVYDIADQYGYTLNGQRRPSNHVVVIYLDDDGFKVVSDGHVSDLGIERERRFCWEQPGSIDGVPRILQGCANRLPEHTEKRKAPPTPTNPPPGG
ncbi:MAG: hypothetical protein Q8R32_03545 [bacterium]|nr:hypothetical protein [bacterium]